MATLKKLMTLLSKNGLAEDRAIIIGNFTQGRTTSAKALHPAEIDALCDSIEEKKPDLDRKRKRVIAVLFSLFEKMNKTVTIEYVKAVACRASRYERFNDIPAYRLESLYNAFLHAQKDLKFSTRLIEGYISEQQNYN